MGHHRLTIRVYYEDTDFSGVVYHANYLRFLERGRTELLRDLGVHQTDLYSGGSGQPIAFAVAHITIDFRRPARMDDLVTVETERVSIGGASLVLRQRLLREDEVLVDACRAAASRAFRQLWHKSSRATRAKVIRHVQPGRKSRSLNAALTLTRALFRMSITLECVGEAAEMTEFHRRTPSARWTMARSSPRTQSA